MDGQFLFEISKLVEVGLKGDREKVAAYADQIATRLEKSGDEKSAQRIRQAIQDRPTRPATATRSAIEQIAMPVDGDSRLPVADVEQFDGEVFLSMGDSARQVLDRFLKCYRGAKALHLRGVEISPTLLVYGPPGGGKTQLAKFVAKELRLPLVTARSDAIISSYLGSTAKNIRLLFEHAAARPCVLFLDEIDAIAKMRDDQHELGELKRVVISLLQNIDALSKEHIVIAATNHAHLLDPAIWRRFSYKLELPLPGTEQRIEILSHFFRSYADAKTISAIATLAGGMSGSQLRLIADESIRDTLLDEPEATRVSLFDVTTIAIEQIAHGQISSDPEAKLRLIYQACREEISQRDLAEMTGQSQSTVSRLVSKWKEGDGEEAINQDRRAG